MAFRAVTYISECLRRAAPNRCPNRGRSRVDGSGPGGLSASSVVVAADGAGNPRLVPYRHLGATRRSGYWGGQARLLGDTLAPSCVTLTPQAMCGGVLRDLTARLDVQIAESGITLR